MPNKDIYDDFKLKKTLWYSWFKYKYFSFVRAKNLLKNSKFTKSQFSFWTVLQR